MVNSGNFNLNNSSVVQPLALADTVALGLYGEGSGSDTGYGTMLGYVNAIHSASGLQIKTKVLRYVITDTTVSVNQSNLSALCTWVNRNNWWLYASGTSGTKQPNYFSSSDFQINTTTFVPLDFTVNAGGWNHCQTYGDWIVRYFVKGTYGGTFQSSDVAPLDGFFVDNTAASPIGPGAYERTAASQSAGDPTVGTAMRNATGQGFAVIKAQAPSLLIMANIGNIGTNNPGGGPSYSGLTNIDLVFIEGLLGTSYSEENFGGWTAIMAQINQAIVLAGDGVISHQVNANGSDAHRPNAGQGTRYGAALAALVGFEHGPCIGGTVTPPNQLIWVDEWAVDSSGNCKMALWNAANYSAIAPFRNWLGAAVQGPWGVLLGNGVFRRDFANGSVYFNHSGNGPQTISGGSFQKLNGSNSTNNGALVGSFNLLDGDALFVL